MGRFGVFLIGDSHLVEHVNVRSNARTGIFLFASADEGASTVRHAMVHRNNADGIFVSSGLVTHSTASANFQTGILILRGTASYNFANRNGFGLRTNGNYFGNNIDRNIFDSVSGGTNHGQNLCDGVTCPGAEF
jgi:hypothetical protein